MGFLLATNGPRASSLPLFQKPLKINVRLKGAFIAQDIFKAKGIKISRLGRQHKIIPSDQTSKGDP